MADCEILFSVPRKVHTRTAARVCKTGLIPTSRKMAFRALALFLAHSALPKQFWAILGAVVPEVQKIGNLRQEPGPNVQPLSLITVYAA